MLVRRIGHWVDGHAVEAAGGRTGPVWDPATGVQQAEVSFASAAEVAKVVEVARGAFPAWRATPLSRRSAILFRFRELLDANRKEVAALITSEHGKTESDALGEVARGLENVEFACGIPQLLKGEYSEQASTGVDVYSIRQPLGVVVGITPFNFPAMVPLWMLSNALACGNTFVLKPSEKDPSASLLLAELLRDAGLPAGVFNVVNGDREAVEALLAAPDVAAVSFVGSTPIARHIYQTGTVPASASRLWGGPRTTWSSCPTPISTWPPTRRCPPGMAPRASAAWPSRSSSPWAGPPTPWWERSRRACPSSAWGRGPIPTVRWAPSITAEHRDRVASYLDSGPAAGADLVVDGRQHDVPASGFFLGPSLVDQVDPGMQVYRDEIFGPVLAVVRVDTYEDALRVVNDNQYGNGTAIFTRDGGAARQFLFDCEVGMVGINVPIPVPVAAYSFGGWKDSLFGDTHMYGPEGIRFYTRAKVVTSRWPDPSTSTVDLGFPRTH